MNRPALLIGAACFAAGWVARSELARWKARRWPYRAVEEIVRRMEPDERIESVTAATRHGDGFLAARSMRERDAISEWSPWGRVPGDARELREGGR